MKVDPPAPGHWSLAKLTDWLRSNESALGPTTSLKANGEVTDMNVDEAKPSPSAEAVIALKVGDVGVVPPGRTLVCDGSACVNSQTLGVIVYR
jgi:hypothetical protein